MRIRTVSGSIYTLVNGRITREAKCNPYLPPELAIPVFANLPCRVLTPAVVGDQFRFSTGQTGRITTSLVVAIERPCDYCDGTGDGPGVNCGFCVKGYV